MRNDEPAVADDGMYLDLDYSKLRDGWVKPGRLGEQLAAISTWVDEHPPNKARDAEARLWGRCAKVVEEAGEVIAAIIAMTGQNPRKGQSGCVADVLDELLDVAATALAAVEHIDGNRGGSVDMLAEHVAGLVERAGLTGPKDVVCTCPPLEPGMGVVDVNRGHLLGCPVLSEQAKGITRPNPSDGEGR